MHRPVLYNILLVVSIMCIYFCVFVQHCIYIYHQPITDGEAAKCFEIRVGIQGGLCEQKLHWG